MRNGPHRILKSREENSLANCKNCGAEISPLAKVCPYCGMPQQVQEEDPFDQTQAYIGGSAASARYEAYVDTGLTRDENVSWLNYHKMVKQYGSSEITKLKKRETISGEIDTDGVYKIGEDFDLGDIVSVKLDNGISATTRLIEIIYADEASGTSVTGTFEEWEV